MSAIAEALASGRFDWIVYIDSDAFFRDSALPLPALLRKYGAANPENSTQVAFFGWDWWVRRLEPIFGCDWWVWRLEPFFGWDWWAQRDSHPSSEILRLGLAGLEVPTRRLEILRLVLVGAARFELPAGPSRCCVSVYTSGARALVCSGQVLYALVRSGLVWSGLVWSGLVRSGLLSEG